MKKLLTLILVLCSIVGFAQMRGGAQYDPGAARSSLSNVDATATPSMTSITLSDKVKAAWADILGDIYASGTVKVSTGTAAAPAYSFGSDPDTGIYSPGADTIGFGEGGAESMRITSGGNVLIGTLTDAGGDYQLQIAKDAIMRSLVASGTSYLWADSNSTYGVNILGGNNLNPTKVFLAGKAGFSNGFTIDFTGSAMQYQFATGNVLIATSTDDGANKLQVNGGISQTGVASKKFSQIVEIQNLADSSTASLLALPLVRSAGQVIIYTSASGASAIIRFTYNAVVISDAFGGNFTNTKDTPGCINVYVESGNLTVQNKTGGVTNIYASLDYFSFY